MIINYWQKILAWRLDWVMFLATLPIVAMGLFSMDSFTDSNYFFQHQIIWSAVGLLIFFVASFVDWRFLRSSEVVATIYGLGIGLLILTLFLAPVTRGAQGWLSLGGVSLEPASLMALALIIILAKYFNRRHVEIANVRHIFVSGIYALLPFFLVLKQPNFGSALIIFAIWLGMIMVSGVSKRHLLLVAVTGLVALAILWGLVFKPYQKARIITFLHPQADLQGAGYNALQSTIAVGSGQLLGKGVGYGTQSRLRFLPEYQTDFIFAAFAEEWGFLGVLIILSLFGVIIWRLCQNALLGASNFETLFGLGAAILLMAHIIIHVGMNAGLLPITGLPLPLMSYGGSHLVTEFLLLGMVNGMRRYAHAFHRDDVHNEFIGPQ